MWKSGGLSNQLKSFINDLLRFDPKKRLGVNGWAEIKNHEFFTCANFSWQDLEKQQIESPLLPVLAQYKMEYKPYDAARMNPDLRLLLPEGAGEMLPSWSVRQSNKIN